MIMTGLLPSSTLCKDHHRLPQEPSGDPPRPGPHKLSWTSTNQWPLGLPGPPPCPRCRPDTLAWRAGNFFPPQETESQSRNKQTHFFKKGRKLSHANQDRGERGKKRTSFLFCSFGGGLAHRPVSMKALGPEQPPRGHTQAP